MADKEKKDKSVLKAEKKLEKAKKKEEKKKMYEEAGEDNPDTIGSKILVWIVALIIVAVWLVIFAILVKMDVGGFGSTVLYPIFKDVPYINRILPEVVEYDDEKEASPYATMDEAIDHIKALEVQLEEQRGLAQSYQSEIADLQNEINQLLVYKNSQEEFEIEKENFYEEIVFSDEAPDISQYQKYYEKIDPESAAALYKEVVAAGQISSDMEQYVATYSSMKPAAAAAIFNNMTKDVSLVAKILDNMDAEARGKILAAMDVDMAVRVTKILNP